MNTVKKPRRWRKTKIAFLALLLILAGGFAALWFDEPDPVTNRPFNHHRAAVDHPDFQTQRRAGADQIERHVFPGYRRHVTDGLQLAAIGAMNHDIAQHSHGPIPGCRHHEPRMRTPT